MGMYPVENIHQTLRSTVNKLPCLMSFGLKDLHFFMDNISCFEQEILQQHLAKLVDDDEADSIAIPRTSTKYKVQYVYQLLLQ